MKTKVFESLRVLLFVLFGLMLMYVVYTALTQLSVSQHEGYRLNALFADLRQLQVGDDVRVAGVRVGSVVNTYLDKGLAVAVLSIEKRYHVPEDSRATILMAGLLGANYIAISPGTSPQVLKSDSFIKTQQATDLSTVIQQFSRVGKKLDHILGNLDKSDGNDRESGFTKLYQVIDNLNVITKKIASGEGTLGKIIMDDKAYDDLSKLMESITVAANKVDEIMDTVKSVVENVKAGQGMLGKLMMDEKTAQDFDRIVKNINEFCEKLNADKSTLGRLISNDELYRKAEGVLNKVEKASDNIANTGPVSAIGAAASALL